MFRWPTTFLKDGFKSKSKCCCVGARVPCAACARLQGKSCFKAACRLQDMKMDALGILAGRGQKGHLGLNAICLLCHAVVDIRIIH